MKEKVKIEISTTSVLKILALILGLVFIYYIRNVVALVFVVAIIVAGLTPFVEWLVKQKIPRIFSVIIVYLALLGIMTLVVYAIIPPLASQVELISANSSYYVNKLSIITDNISTIQFQSQNVLEFISKYLGNISGSVVTSIASAFGGAASAVTVMVLSFYILLERNSVEKILLAFMHERHHEKTLKIYEKLNSKLGRWLRGQVLLAFIIGLASYIVLTIFGIKYALALAVIAGALEIVPIIGPIFAGALAAIVAYFTDASWWTIIGIIISYIVVQQLEGHFLVPNIMGQAVGLSPVIIIIAIMIGSQLGGIIGAILAIPIAAAVAVVAQQWGEEKKLDI